MSTTTRKGASTAAVAVDLDTRTSTIVVAASNSLDPTLAPLLYRCSGVADNVEMNAALVAAAAVNGSVELLEGDYNTVLTLSVAVNVTFKAVGWGAVINFNAAGNAITIAGDNVKLRDFKVVIVAGAGAGGSRPNCVYATGRTNVEISKLWLYGDQTEADDGDDQRQCGILFGINMAYTKILGCTVQNFERHSINFVGTDGNEVEYVVVKENICYDNLGIGIRLTYADYCTVSGNTCMNSQDGIFLLFSDGSTVTGNTCNENTVNGISLGYLALNTTVTGNTCNENTENGILINQSNNTVTGNTCSLNTENGILCQAPNCTVTGNHCTLNVWHGIALYVAKDNLLAGNTCNGNDSGDTGNYDGINISNASHRNLVIGNQCQDQQGWGIQVNDDSDYNKISMNYTNGNVAGSINVNGATCDNNQVEFNTVEEGAPVNTGTATRSYGNYDPSADAFVGDVGATPW